MAMVVMASSSMQADSQLKSFILVRLDLID